MFLTENHLILKDNDREFLKQYNLRDLYNSINENTNENLVSIFNMYYTGMETNE